MSDSQAQLVDYSTSSTPSPTPSSTRENSEGQGSDAPLLGVPPGTPLPDTVTRTEEAASADWVIFTGRYPHVFDAIRLGYGIGHREDSGFQWTPDEVDLPVNFLDNDYEDASLSRFVDRVFDIEPEIAVLGDIYDAEALDDHLSAAEELWASYPELEILLVPKCESVLDDIPEDIILGYPNGNSNVQATDVAPRSRWRSQPNRLHILGGTPLSTHGEIAKLVQPNVTGEPPADIAGIDWNGYQLYAERHGDYADASGGWHRNLRDQYVPKRELLRYSLLNARIFWTRRGVWPETGPTEHPSREDMVEADAGASISPSPSKLIQELFVSPSGDLDRHESPLYRTDKTQTEIQEPLSPLSVQFSKSSWVPSGTLKEEAQYTSPPGHQHDGVCAGCGAHVIAEPDETAGAKAKTSKLTVALVSYKQKGNEKDHDYPSVPTEGPNELPTDEPFAGLHYYCSDNCRNRTERQTPRLLANVSEREDCWVEGVEIGSFEIKLRSER